MSNTELKWDFSELYTGFDDPQITSDMEALIKKADEFEKKYHGQIKKPNFTASDLLYLFKEIEQFYIDKEELGLFARNSRLRSSKICVPKSRINREQNSSGLFPLSGHS
ncbi:MAG: hypothetical protein P8Y23_09865 [Candidatus Lokiarchaeota archaeon]